MPRPKQIDGGLEITITGSGRTLVAIQRMIPAYARNDERTQRLDRQGGFVAGLANYSRSPPTDPKEIQHIRGLGFIGLLVSGSMHQPHHLAMAKGEFDHGHLSHNH